MTTQGNMQLRVEGDFGGGTWKVDTWLFLQQFVRKAFDYLVEIAKTDSEYCVMDTDTDSDRRMKELPFSFYAQFFEKEFEATGTEGFVMTRCSHRIEGTLNWERYWAALRITTRTEPSTDWDYEYRFAKISGAGGNQDRAMAIEEAVPEQLEIGSDGSIVGDGIYFKPLTEVWPLPVFDFAKYEPLGRLNYELNVNDLHTLTILIRSPQPYQGMGRQIANRFWEVRDTLVRSYGLMPDEKIDKKSVLNLKKRRAEE